MSKLRCPLCKSDVGIIVHENSGKAFWNCLNPDCDMEGIAE